MRAAPPRPDLANVSKHLALASRAHEVQALGNSFGAADAELVSTVLDAVARFAADVLVPLNESMDRCGVRIIDGNVMTAPGHREAWRGFTDDGWTTLEHLQDHGGQGLPLALALAVQEQVDRACPAFGMLLVLQRAASRLVAAWADADVRKRYLPGLIAGRIGATICISEPGAGSDVAQLRTRAVLDAAGNWRITGEKCWISYGNHDLTDEIVHCVLAQTGPDSTRPEIGLFLVEGGTAQGPAVQSVRVEEKLGLHGSPTCVITFDGAKATLLGDASRGLSQMFVMITQMRLAVGAMGLGIASSATDTALAYAFTRRQGGSPGDPALIAEHVDIQRQLTGMIARTELLRGALFDCANHADIAQFSADPGQRAASSALLQILLPIIKTMGADAAFMNASDALQVLGGAGYTREWPIEQALRDARVLSVFEGTTGIQGLDLVHRRIRGNRTGFDLFVAEARSLRHAALDTCLDRLETCAAFFADASISRRDIDAGAQSFLDLATLAVSGWVAARWDRCREEVTGRMGIAAQRCLLEIEMRAAALETLVKAGAGSIAGQERLAGLASE